jgi:hypothetical protein
MSPGKLECRERQRPRSSDRDSPGNPDLTFEGPGNLDGHRNAHDRLKIVSR